MTQEGAPGSDLPLSSSDLSLSSSVYKLVAISTSLGPYTATWLGNDKTLSEKMYPNMTHRYTFVQTCI